MLNARVALLALPITLTLGQAALASSTSLSPLTPRTQVAASATCANPAEAARVVDPFMQYPTISKELGREGVADVGIQLSATGQVDRAWLIRSSGDLNLDRAGLQTARASRYSPERSNCAAVGGTYLLEADFSQ